MFINLGLILLKIFLNLYVLLIETPFSLQVLFSNTALSFCLLMGISISPSILSYAMNTTYAKTLTLPDRLLQVGDKAILEEVKSPDILQSEEKRTELRKEFEKMGNEGAILYQQTFNAIRDAMESGLRKVFLIGAITALLSFLLILTIPEIPIGSGAEPE